MLWAFPSRLRVRSSRRSVVKMTTGVPLVPARAFAGGADGLAIAMQGFGDERVAADAALLGTSIQPGEQVAFDRQIADAHQLGRSRRAVTLAFGFRCHFVAPSKRRDGVDLKLRLIRAERVAPK